MSALEIKGGCRIIKGQLKQKWATLTDDNLDSIQGQQDELLSRVQKRTGESREAVEAFVNEYSAAKSSESCH